MKVRTLGLAGLGSLFLAGAAFAGLPAEPGDFLVTEHVNTYENPDGDVLDVYQLYACFEGDGGLVSFWGSEEGFTITNDLESQGDAAGSGFWANAAGGLLPPEEGGLYDLFPDQFDNGTWLTIGVAAGYGDDATGEVFQPTPGFDPDIIGQASFGGIGGVVANPGAPNTLAGPDGKVLLGQFAVLQGEHVSGQDIVVTGQVDGESFTLTGLSFTTIPAPGALALLGLAGLAGTRRRRA